MRRAIIRSRAAATGGSRRLFLTLPMLLATAALVSACGGSSSNAKASSGASSASSTVNIALTPAGCDPKPAKVPAGQVTVNVTNKDAGAVSEAELRTSDLSHILGEQENLTPGLSGGFSLAIQPGRYVINCPGASQMHWSFTVTGKASGESWTKNAQLSGAVSSYSDYVDRNVAKLVSTSQAMCTAIGTGSLSAAELAYPKSRVYYEQIEPVAEIWGALDTDIDGRWDNPVTVASQFMGFHRIEQLMWEDNTLKGTASLCQGLVHHEQQLLALVRKASYNPLEMAGGAADLIDEAGTAKVTGEEERYSNTDLVVLQANVVAAQEIVSLLRPYLKLHDAKLLSQIDSADAAAEQQVSRFRSTPGYDGTGYVEYSTVLNGDREKLAKALSAYKKTLDKLSLVTSA
ncbi:MAG TPA: iron uptake system protein EfeO [Solirubrobacteraceae bacterium]|nr:iron uptake system protein EfeO [Solirubrobacteraceae bacterium]